MNTLNFDNNFQKNKFVRYYFEGFGFTEDDLSFDEIISKCKVLYFQSQ